MKECWSEGNLRAYHDGELPPANREQVAAHLAECPKCEALADEVAGRAARVAQWMAALPEPGQVMWTPRRAPQRVRVRPWWAAVAGTVAAGVAVAVWLAPDRQEQVEPPLAVTAAPVITLPTSPRLQTLPRTIPAASPVRQTTKPPAPRRKAARDVFLALDDEPFETGVIVRVALGEAEIPAEVVFSRDGRARAIRLVSSLSNH